jgi:predicted transposase/invertase (TIGR01784 family)
MSIFLNSKGSREGISKELAAFLDYVEGKTPSSKFTKDLAMVVDETKENKEKRVEYMSYMMDMLRSEERGIEKGRKEGREEGIISTFKELVKDGTLTIETAAKKMGVSVDDFRKMAML